MGATLDADMIALAEVSSDVWIPNEAPPDADMLSCVLMFVDAFAFSDAVNESTDIDADAFGTCLSVPTAVLKEPEK